MLEAEAQCQLDLARRPGSHGPTVDGGDDGTKDSRSSREICLRSSVLRMVEDVEDFSPELKPSFFRQYDIFRQSYISLPRARRASEVAHRVAERPRGGCSEGSRIDPFDSGSAARGRQ